MRNISHHTDLNDILDWNRKFSEFSVVNFA